ncbi:peptidoglycan DD-metalloendopeptidase family protein [Winogradskyella eckloniae]|uniref:peptidoglycan DD-metalloendopeptidase family protein n=1 Tax=Winogradskyella eckloniae TaxID=1089306 RepID=UPI001565E109|nr:peptidoglycan DD-metalloendopeptidase family protein [Winogradskyella eckloniae]NRD20070.1 peptidoglycan DD-metalloendopeptidase family protein [Winogradskyella eckloniae]
MKYLFLSVLFICTTWYTLAQKDSISTALKIELKTETYNKGVIIDTIEIPLIVKPTKTPVVDIKAAFWDNINHNPYQNSIQKFPLELSFSDSTYASPVLHKKVITSRYGWRRGRPHNGIDIDLVTGDSVVAVLDGIVRIAKYSNGFGNVVVVRHYNGLESTYAHLSHIAVKANDTIAKAQYLGKGGNTGNSRGSHLHLELSYKGQPIHPEYIFDFSSKNAIRSQRLWVTHKWAHARFHNSKRVSKIKLITTEDEAALASLAKQPRFYVVKKGDTLYGISRRNNMSVARLCKTNSINQNTTLKIGQKLVLDL